MADKIGLKKDSPKILKEWNGFGFKFVTKPDYPNVLTNLNENFYTDEPLSKTSGLTPERKAAMDKKISYALDLDQGSFYAYPLDQPDKIAAVLIIWFHEKGKSLPRLKPAVSQLLERYNVFEKRNVTVYPELWIISTDKPYRGKGLATEMYQKAIDQLRSQGYPFVTSTFSNPLSRKIGERLGFQTVCQMRFDEFKHPDGSSVYGEEGKSHFVVETILDL